jgi:hypothetical protein
VRLTTAEERDRLLATCEREAVHLEMRDAYAVQNETARLAAFLATGRYTDDEDPDRQEWLNRIRALTGAGKRVRRVRIVSEPVTDYIRFEWAGTGPNVEAGEEVRWLPRRLASGIAVPGNDFWLFDDAAVVFTVFTGAGEVAERQLYTDPAVVELCRSAFAATWSAATPHSDYAPR